MALDPDAHHVPGLPLVPVGGRPDRNHARHRLAVLAPDLQPEPGRLRRSGGEPDEVVGDGEARRLGFRLPRQAPRPRAVDVAATLAAPVAGDSSLVPAQVIRHRDIGEKVEAELVAAVPRSLFEPGGLDYDGGFTVFVGFADEAG